MQEQDISAGDATEVQEEEPRLKYQRLGASVTDILDTVAASWLCVSDKILALGTHNGTLHILDVNGNEVAQFCLNSSCKVGAFDTASEPSGVVTEGYQQGVLGRSSASRLTSRS